MPTYSYNSSNELTSNSSGSYTYDANGNTLSDASGKQYTWDFENRLVQAVNPGVGTTTFRYDPFGRRIQKSGPLGTTNYLYSGPNLEEEVDSTGNVVARYVQGLTVDEPLSEFRSGGASYYEADVLGSITSLSNSSAALANTYIYDSYGNVTASTGTVVNPFQYTGRDYDSESGLRYYRTRYYDSSNGRFTSEDLAGFAGGMNFYRYVGNSPIRFLDPYGLSQVNPQDMASLINLFPGSTAQGDAGVLIPMPCTEVRKIIEQNGFYSNDNWSSWNPFLFFDPLFHRGGWEFRKKDGMHIRMKYPSAPCDKNCTLDEAHNDDYNPMYDPWGHFEYELLPGLGNAAGIPSNVNGRPLMFQ
ncbi:MAG: RHS repeat-associated core domain-containing protein [Candidatus Sulfotelmatobacter sp.]